MTREELLVIKNRLANTTPGTWEINESTDERRYVTDVWIDGEDNGLIEIHRLGEAQKYNDAEFIAHSKSDMTYLIEEVERLQKANRERVKIIEEQNKKLNKFQMDKSLMDFGISTERVRVVEKEKIPNQAFRNRKRQVKHLTRGCIRRNAEIKRLRERLNSI